MFEISRVDCVFFQGLVRDLLTNIVGSDMTVFQEWSALGQNCLVWHCSVQIFTVTRPVHILDS